MIINKHYAWIDIGKGIGIIFIVLGHAANTGIIKDYFFSFHIPLLILLSGIVFHCTTGIGDFIKRNVNRLLVPYVVFSLLSIVIFWAAGIVKPSITEGMNTDVLHNVCVMIYGNSKPDIMKYNSPLWYLPCFFVVQFIAFGIEKFIIARKNSKEGGVDTD